MTDRHRAPRGVRAACARGAVCAALFAAIFMFSPLLSLGLSPAPASAESTGVKSLLDGVVAGIKKSPALGPFDKLGLKTRVNGILAALGAMHAGDAGQKLPTIHARYAAMLDGLVRKLTGKDPALIAKVEKTRDPLWQALVTPAGYRLVAGEPKRSPQFAANR